MSTTATQPVEPEVDQATGKFIYMYQPRDSEGQFIGKPYRYLYTDNQDLVRQITEGKEAGDRFIHEVKTGKRKLVGDPAVPLPEFKPAPESAEETDRKRRAEFRKTSEEEFGAPPEMVRETLKKAVSQDIRTTAYHWALNKQADGYYPCKANGDKIAEWIIEKKLALTPANYDLAFEELRDSLVQEPKEAPPADSTQPPPTQAARPQSTGIIPGQFAGTRQPNSTEKRPLTRERFRQIDKMSRDQFNQLKRTNRADYDAFVLMKTPAQPQQ